jgi:dihydroorotate dehydrogenase
MDPSGKQLFNGEMRGIAGESIRGAALQQLRLFSGATARHAPRLRLVGVGGISSGTHVREFLGAGAHAVQLATAAMLDPEVGLRIREELGGPAGGLTWVR